MFGKGGRSIVGRDEPQGVSVPTEDVVEVGVADRATQRGEVRGGRRAAGSDDRHDLAELGQFTEEGRGRGPVRLGDDRLRLGGKQALGRRAVGRLIRGEVLLIGQRDTHGLESGYHARQVTL